MIPTSRVSAELPSHQTCDVAIVGYGPVGIVFAALLARYGLKPVVVERWPQRYPLPRAGHFDGEIMRTAFQRLGVAEQVEMIARSVLSVETVTPTFDVLESVTFGNDGSGWKSDYLSYQPEFEDIVDARGKELGIKVFMGVTAIGAHEHADRVTLSVRPTDDSDAAPSTIEAAFVVGADGANSFIRSAIGAIKHDSGFPRIDNLVIDFMHKDPDRDIPALGEVRNIADIRRPTHAGRWGGGRGSRLEFRVFDHESREQMESDETAWRFIEPFGLTRDSGEIIRRVVYTFESSITRPWRAGRVLLMGDAAHTMPPYLGQGMCSGVRDGVNLAWKLEAILSGKAHLSLLDTYESERSPHVQALTEMSSMIGKRIQITDSEAAKLRDATLRADRQPKSAMAGPFPRLGPGIVRQAEHPEASDYDGRPSLQGRVIFNGRIARLDEFLKPGWRLITRHRVPEDLLSPRHRAIIAALGIAFAHVSRAAGTHYIDLDADYDLWFRKTGRKAFLLRPDSYVYGSAAAIESVPTLLDDLAACLSSRGWLGLAPHQDLAAERET